MVVATLAIAAMVITYAYLRRRAHINAGEANVFWRQKLKEAQSGIQEDPKSSFWHSQAAIAYDALGDLANFEREIRFATELDPGNPVNYYGPYIVYKRRGLEAQRDEALRKALEADPKNPSSHYELGYIYEKRGHWNDALREYQTAQTLLQRLRPERYTMGPSGRERVYIDFRGTVYPVEFIWQDISKAIKRASARVQVR